MFSHLVLLWKNLGSAAVVVPSVPGAEYTARGERVHYTAKAERLHYKPAVSRLHYTASEE